MRKNVLLLILAIVVTCSLAAAGLAQKAPVVPDVVTVPPRRPCRTRSRPSQARGPANGIRDGAGTVPFTWRGSTGRPPR